ncbi:hypothetical protein CYMTET_35548, partial [Cymbomonas tetramitiformis]
EDFHPSFVFDFFSTLDTLCVVPLIWKRRINTWLSFSYLRVAFIMVSLRRIEASTEICHNLMPTRRSGEFYFKLLQSVCIFLAMIVVMAGTMFILELLGEPQGLGDIFFPNAADNMDVSFYSMMYFVCVTISTVGYGDYSPTTLLSQFFTILCIIQGVALVSIQTHNLMEYRRNQVTGSGTFRAKYWRNCNHVVIIGGGVDSCNTTLLAPIIEELSCPSSALLPEVVVMGTQLPTEEMQALLIAFPSVCFLRGSPLIERDLQRCEMATCEMCFIIADVYAKVLQPRPVPPASGITILQL